MSKISSLLREGVLDAKGCRFYGLAHSYKIAVADGVSPEHLKRRHHAAVVACL